MDRNSTKVMKIAMGCVGALVLIALAITLFRDRQSPEANVIAPRPVSRTQPGQIRDGIETPSREFEVKRGLSPTPTPAPTTEGALSEANQRDVAQAGADDPANPIGLPGDVPMATPLPYMKNPSEDIKRLREQGIDVDSRRIIRPPALRMIPETVPNRGGASGGRVPISTPSLPRPTSTPGSVHTSIPTETPVSTDDGDGTPTPTPEESPTPTPTPEVGTARLFLEPGGRRADIGQTVPLRLMLNAQEKAVAGYTTIVLFNPLEVQVNSILEGSDPLLGYPLIAELNDANGTLVLGAMQGSFFDRPIGNIHLLTIEFMGLEPAAARINLVESEVSNTDAQRMNLVMERGATIEIMAPPPTPTPVP